MKVIMVFTAVVVIILLAAGIAEGVLHRRNIRRVPIRILVNGTRGKTSTARLIAASLNSAGIRTVCRTTGSEAVLVMPDGSTSPVIRKRGARITELIAFTKLCVQENAKAMVIECMALSEENQRTVADSLIQPTHVVFTNSYVDHVPEQGITEEQVAWTLARSIHKGSQVFCTEDYYRQYCEEKGSTCHKVDILDYEKMGIESGVPVHNQNFSLAVELCRTLGVDEKTVIASAAKAQGDVGLLKEIPCPKGAVLIPDFSVNDIHCMQESIDSAIEKHPGRKLNLIFNSRADREYRILLIGKVLENCSERLENVYCVGSYPAKVKRYLSRRSKCPVFAVSDEKMSEIMINAEENEMFLGIGNIKGSGEALIERLSQGGECNA